VIRVAHSPWRLLGYAVVAVSMILLALEMTVTYKFYPRPEATTASTDVTAADGSVTQVTSRVLTETGKAQWRRDLAWGSALGLGGVALIGWAFAGLVAPRRLLAADAAGLSVWLDGRRAPPLHLAWEEVAEVRSGLRQDEGGEVAVLSLRLHDAGRIPAGPAGAAADPPWLHLYAGEWDRPPEEVAALVEGYVTMFRGWETYG
jgi:hypothetical protein